MAKQSKAQKETVERVMHAYKEGDLESGSGTRVKSRRQAVAIALSESGASNRQSPKENREKLRRTKARERGDATRPDGAARTKSDLYAEARRRDIAGRSSMSKAELERALGA